MTGLHQQGHYSIAAQGKGPVPAHARRAGPTRRCIHDCRDHQLRSGDASSTGQGIVPKARES